ncbi:MAG: hypothetical protein ACJ72N_08010 [Labedaea sp.]
MSAIWVVSMVLQWLVIALLSSIVVVLLRHHGRSLAGDGVLAAPGPRPGMAAPGREVRHAAEPGRAVRIGGSRDIPQLIVFYSPSCTPCKSTQEAVEEFAVTGPPAGIRFVVVLADARTSALRYLDTGVLTDLDVVLLEDFPAEMFPGSTPAAVAVRHGQVTEVGRPHSSADLAAMAGRLAGTSAHTQTGGSLR